MTKKQTKGSHKRAVTIESRHAETIIQTDNKGHIWIDTLTLALELQVSPFTWSGLLLPEVDKHYGDRNCFRRVHGRRALWDFTLIDRWYRQRQSPKAGFKPRYIQRLEARGEVVA
jgi:hypothetical protein